MTHVSTVDPIAQRCADLVNATEKKLGPSTSYVYSAEDFQGGGDKLSLAELALRNLVKVVSDAVRAYEYDLSKGCPVVVAGERLRAFKVPHAGDLFDEAFAIAMRAQPGEDKRAIFHAELAKRHVGIFIDAISLSLNATT
jgi:hypothetical protein